MTTPPKHRSPSKDRYAANHPAITVHFDLDTYKRLIALRDATGWSLNELVRAALDSLEAQVATILERGRREGVTEGKKIGEAAGRKTGYDEGWKDVYKRQVSACVIAWALTSSWPLEASALVLGSVIAGCIADPLRSKLAQMGAS